MSINRVTITGNLTRDPELRATAGGSQVLRLGVAVNDRWFNQQTNNWEDRPNYIDCVVFGKRADALSRYLHKGMKVAIEGKLRWSQWEDRETNKNRSKIEVIVDDLEFMSGRGDAQGQGGYGNNGYGNPQPQDGYQGGYANQGQGNYQPQGNFPAGGYQPQNVYAPEGQGAQQARPQMPAPQQEAPAPVASVPPSTNVSDSDIPF